MFRQLLGLDCQANAICVIVAEIAQAHDGSLGMAHAYIDAVADAGADAVKFQTHIAAAESTLSEPWRVKFSRQDATRYDYWKRMEFTEDQWRGLKQHASDRGLLFLSSPFSSQAVELLQRVGVAAWKVASGEIGNEEMLNQMAASKLPFIVSTGMSPLSEIDAAVEFLTSRCLPVAILQCTTCYPCPPEKVGLNMISFFRERYNCAIGLSDHSGTIYPGLAAVVLGAEIVEVHVTFDRRMFGPDVVASITIPELEQMVAGIRYIETMLSHPANKDESAKDTAPLRQLFTKSIVARVDIPADTILRQELLIAKKPGTGMPANEIGNVIGRRVTRSLRADELLSYAHLD